MLKVKNLKAKIEEKEILKGVDLEIKGGEIQALLGPNGSGKSVLAQTISGNPKYKITKGEVFFFKKNITKLSPEKRVKLGIVSVWQTPPEIKGLRFSSLLEKISQKQTKIEKMDFSNFLERELNVGFSGGEKKISELLQVLSLNPKLVIFDEIDSGLDIKKLEKVAKIIKKELVEKGVSILLITHWGQILEFLKPDWTSVMVDGKIICKAKDFRKVLKTINKYGYEKCKQCSTC